MQSLQCYFSLYFYRKLIAVFMQLQFASIFFHFDPVPVLVPKILSRDGHNLTGFPIDVMFGSTMGFWNGRSNRATF